MAVPVHVVMQFPVYVGAMKNVEAGETTLSMLPLIPGDTAYMFALMP